MDNTPKINAELAKLTQTIEEQKKIIEGKDKTIETLNRELVKCKTEYELLEKRYKETKQELDNILKIVEDVKALIKSKDQYIKSLEEEKKGLTILNIGFFIAVLILIAIFIVFSLKS
ncbi:hypothetical protein HY04AAS1_0315 [Hydrogenobaculum sp. Y04AAS1]|uniref:hypothetical protein n=1 Tax=Hydrogenobaculum sp. (strain Y04AAS1) TaxID=380749 RepID=UPI00015BD059|nr:hypothetical protein HY04AAS1_0315 [Hydrogenobaculum sp. Y04AAS1]HCT66595.1 hypothetical protein [Hydrogenobaculum sp.]